MHVPTHTITLTSLLLCLLTGSSSTSAHPFSPRSSSSSSTPQSHDANANSNHTQPSRSLDVLVDGNRRFRDKMASGDRPDIIHELAEKGQSPPFLFLGCADSRVNDGTIFDALPGTFFTERNIANQYHRTDGNVQASLAYGLTELGVEHVIVMGHYGCGGVAGSIASPPSGNIDAAGDALQSWIQPIRELFETSTRQEIVSLRQSNANSTAPIPPPKISDPGFRALVEENVKHTVRTIVEDSVVVNIYHELAALAAGADGENACTASDEGGKEQCHKARKRSGEVKEVKNVFVHGLVYDIETGTITDLGVSVGPPGVEVPTYGSLL